MPPVRDAGWNPSEIEVRIGVKNRRNAFFLKIVVLIFWVEGHGGRSGVSELIPTDAGT